MMAIEERLKMYREKKNFVFDVSKVFNKNRKGHSVEDINYFVLFKETDRGQHFSEWIVVHYYGGGKACKCVSGNSNSANFQNIASLIDGGYYEENRYYSDLVAKDWKELDLTKMSSLQVEK